MKTSLPSPCRSQRGSLLIVAMILCAVIGISLVSYLNLGRSSMTISNRGLYNSAAMNLAENGLEEAMYALNKDAVDGSYDWVTTGGWTLTGSGNVNARRRLTPPSGTFDQGTTGYVNVYVYNYAGTAPPKAVARAVITLAGVTTKTIEKWVYIQARTTSKFANGLVAKNSLTFNGNNASVDSWDSKSDTTTTADDIKYSAGVRDDNGSIGSISVAVGAVGVNNADIWGFASTGAGLPSVGSNGVIGPFGTANGTMDMSHVSSDFTASFDPVTAPTSPAPTAITAIGNGDLPMTVGTVGATTSFSLPSISASGNSTKVLTIVGNVTLVLTNTAGSSAIGLTGQSGIVLAPGATLKIYTAGDISIAGNGVTNGGTTAATANNPSNFQIWGTSTTTQDIKVAGNGVLSAIVYAPNANVTINGNGDVEGSVVANNITLTGNAAFHYDESLARFGGANPYRVASWRELTQDDIASSNDDRAFYRTDLTW
ncbi:MAG: hypothetical protein PSW75_09740 [bacterium]|nr:hypothetical protein [bacterium]